MRIPAFITSSEPADSGERPGSSRADLLCRMIERAAGGRIECDVERFDSQEETTPFNLHVETSGESIPILIFVDSGVRQRQSAFAVVRRLRSERCIWNPIHLFLERMEDVDDLSVEWCIWMHEMPPHDVRAAVHTIDVSHPLPRAARPWFVAQAMRNLADRLQRLIEPLDPSCISAASAVIPHMRVSHQTLGADAEIAEIRTFREEISELLALPQLPDRDVARMLQRVRELELDPVASRLTTRSRTELHALKNKLLLARSRHSSEEWLQGIVRTQTDQILDRGLPALAESDARPLQSGLATLQDLLRPPSVPARIDELSACASELQTAARRLFARMCTEPRSGPARLLVVEDDPDWRSRLLSWIDRFPISRRVVVEQATTVEDARRSLKSGGAAVVIVDLGLPLEASGPISLDGGLRLIEEFSRAHPTGRLPQHSFLILTAMESLGQAVEKAVALGISPSGYLLKDSTDLEAELEGRLSLAFRRKRPLRIDLFDAAPRQIHVDGHEVTLDLPLWCLLRVLADHPRWSASPERVANRMSIPPFSLDPGSREPDESDPAIRIERQLPKYRSELNLLLVHACKRIRGELPPDNIVELDEEGYRLNADVRVFAQAPYFAPDHRPRVLVVEDDIEWSQAITTALHRNGFEFVAVRTLEAARAHINDPAIDLVTLDLELPEDDVSLSTGHIHIDGGLRFLNSLRDAGRDVPVVLLTGTSPKDRAMLPLLKTGLRSDDFLFKHDPEPIRGLLASVDRLWRETLTNCQILDWDPSNIAHSIAIDSATSRLLSVAGHPINVSGLGATLLHTLSSRPNSFVGRSELIETLFPDPDRNVPEDPEKALDQHVKRLRKSISEQTNGSVDGNDVICGGRGVYWLRGIVKPSEG